MNPIISPRQVRLAMATSALAVFMANLDVSIVNIALPTLCKLYHVDATKIAIVVISYMLSLTGLLLVAGRLSDIRGTERIFIAGYWIFIAGSAMCAAAPSLNWLVLFRLLQGVGGAFLFATSAVIVVLYVPADRLGRAYSLNGLLAGVAVACGAPIGGFLVQNLGWRWIFLINIPVGLAALFMGRLAFRNPQPGNRSRFDTIGAVYSVLFLLLLLFALHIGEDTGWLSPRVLGSFALSGIFLALFLLQEARCPAPLMDLSLFRHIPLAAALFGNFLYLFLLGGLNFVLPFFFQVAKRLSPQMAGLYMMIFPSMSILLSSLSGYLSDKIGPRRICITAMGFFVVSTLGFRLLDESSSFATIAAVEVLFGIGLALFVTAVLTMIMTYSQPGKAGMLSAVKALIPNLGAAIGVSLFAFLYNAPDTAGLHVLEPKVHLAMQGYRNAMGLAVAVAVLGFAAMFWARPRAQKRGPSPSAGRTE